MLKVFSRAMTVAYFSMEIGLDSSIPTYSGGLGILAGDTLKAASDLGVPLVGVTLLYRKGYFRQKLDASTGQIEAPFKWVPEDRLERLDHQVEIKIEGRSVRVGVWRVMQKGIRGYAVPIYFLDTDLPRNSSYDQELTGQLYGGDSYYRLCQEAVLGYGGHAMLRELGYADVRIFHMNEGHSALLTLALLEERMKKKGISADTADSMDRKAVREQCIFTTHTPVPAGHDQFNMEMVKQVLGLERAKVAVATQGTAVSTLNMTHLGLSLSRYVNGVALSQRQVSRTMFPAYPVNSIANGVHAATWASPPFAALFDTAITGWREDNMSLRYALDIPLDDIRQTHLLAKSQLLEEVERQSALKLAPDIFTIGFARRATGYKRPGLLFSDIDRLKHIAQKVGPLQIIYAGKAHPHDEGGKELIHYILRNMEKLKGIISIVYLEEYDMRLASLIVSGVDLWLNTPQRPQEASGTSGMKAALNGVPSLSVLDGWWVEGHVEGVTGWAIGTGEESEPSPVDEILSLYDKLERVIMPLYYREPYTYAQVMRSAIALNGSFFNTQRMILQYVQSAYAQAMGIVKADQVSNEEMTHASL